MAVPTNGASEPNGAVSAYSGAKKLRFLVIGAGSRGNAYGRAVTVTTRGDIHAIAEPHAFKRREFGKNYIWGSGGRASEGQEFADWKDWLGWETDRRQKKADGLDVPDGIDGVFVCTLDEMHVEILEAIAPLNLHILSEKPLATSLDDCLTIYNALRAGSPSKIFSIGHVLRYSPHNTLLRDIILTDKVIGDVVSLEHCEPVGWWHFSHSYVRGNWRRETLNGDGSLLTKSCHDIDFILWLLCSPPPGSEVDHPPHEPRSISSMGTLTQFRPQRKPAAAGTATNCLSCPAERVCNYSALKIYRDMHLAKGLTEWPVNIVCPDIEDTLTTSGTAAAEDLLLGHLRQDYDRAKMSDETIASRPWYGRCVYEADNNVCDDQVVTIAWDEDSVHKRPSKTASFHMIAPTEKQCERRGRVYGTHGEVSYDSRTITIYSFATRSTTVIEVPRQPPEEEKAHGGGDYGLTRAFVAAVDAVENGGMDVSEAQMKYVGCSLEEAVRSHAVVFAAEEARREEKVVKWKDWWKQKLATAGAS
ncbi:hypothetical protein Plec18170_007113 [Paecilomyces lecythidis]